jgi:hypothetical protein
MVSPNPVTCGQQAANRLAATPRPYPGPDRFAVAHNEDYGGLKAAYLK